MSEEHQASGGVGEDDEVAKLTRERDDARLAHQCSEGVLAMTVARLSGVVEGRPTGRHNFLQRIDELVALEKVYKEGKEMSDQVPDGVYVYQPHPVSRKDGRLWSIGGLPSGMTREEATALAEAANKIFSTKAAQ